MSSFDDAFAAVVGVEGGFTNDPRDKGNWTGGAVDAGQCRGTKYGISAASYPTLDIANLTLDAARAIYKRDFWDKLQADKLDAALAFQAFDAAVNCGVYRAAKWLQRAANVAQDGAIGPQSLAALMAAEPWRIAVRLDAYRLLSNADTGVAFTTYGRGWSIRVANNLLTLAG